MLSTYLYDLQMALLSKAAGAAPRAMEGPEVTHPEAATHEASAAGRSKASAESETQLATPAPQASAVTTVVVKTHAPRKRKGRHLLR